MIGAVDLFLGRRRIVESIVRHPFKDDHEEKEKTKMRAALKLLQRSDRRPRTAAMGSWILTISVLGEAMKPTD